MPQYDSATSSERESAVRSVSPRKANRTAMNAVVAEFVLNSLGVGCVAVSNYLQTDKRCNWDVF